MRDPRRLNGAERLELQVRADPVEEARPTTQENRDDVQLELVQEPGRQVLVDDVAPPPMKTSLSPAAALAWSRADSTPSVTKVKVVSERVSGSRS